MWRGRELPQAIHSETSRMPELVCHRDQISSRAGFRARDASPDSVIFTLESNFSLFSSTSASVDRCSFASDAYDHEYLASEISLCAMQHLAAHDRQESYWSGPDPNKLNTVGNNNKQHTNTHTRPSRKAEKAKAVQKEEDDNNLLDSARSSFSLALKECQESRSRSDAITKKPDRRRPASLDLNNVVTSPSPRLGNMKKSIVYSSRKSGTFPSPGTPKYHSSAGMQKGWSSERVPLPNNSNRRQVMNATAAAVSPFNNNTNNNNNGRTLPSKWEDAERWIFSPVSGDGFVRSSIQPAQRRPKSKSGPLGPPGVAYYSLYSPAIQVFDGRNMGNFIAGSPFSASVIAADGLAVKSNGSHGVAFPMRTEPCMARSVSVHGCSEMLAQSSLPSQDEKFDGVKDAATDISRAVSRRDMATQMSPEGSNHSSPTRQPSFSVSTPSSLPIVELLGFNPSKSEVRDVQVDERITVTRWSKKHRARNHGKSSEIVDDWRKEAADALSSGLDVSEAGESISKVKREEAKITAWENLQKANAEAEIRKLEMKLEKKRSSSMEKTMSALSRLFRSTFSTATSAAATENTIVRSLSNEVFRERSLKRLVEKFKKASENERFRTKSAIYKDTIRRLAAAKKFRYVEEILENQKQYQDMSKEGFNARLISLYGSSGMFDNARKVFDEMLERKCARTVLSFNALLGACVNSKKFDEVGGLFRGLSEELEIEPDLVSYNTVMKAFCEMGSLDSAVSLLDEIEKKGLNPDLITFNTLLNGLYANGRFDAGERIWQRMKEKNVKPDGRSYNEKLLGLALEKRMKDATKVVEEMKSEGIEFDIFSYNALIRGFVNEGDLEEAKGWYGEIRKSDIKPDKLTFKTLIPFVVEKGDVAFAFDLCKDALSSKLAVKEALIQPVLDALAKESKINEAKELVELSKARRSDSLKLTLPSI